MTKLITIEKSDLSHFLSTKGSKNRYCKELESGNILFIPYIPFAFPDNDLQFLLAQRQTAGKNHKNIAYKPKSNTISNAISLSDGQSKRLLEVMQLYSKSCATFLAELLPTYACKWQ